MTDAKLDPKRLTDLNGAVQNATFPSVQFAQTVRDWIAAATKEMEPKIEGAKVSPDPNCNPYNHHWDFGYCHTCNMVGHPQPDSKPASEGAKVECPNCKAAVEQPWAHYPGGWRCPTLPAQPEAPGLLEAVQRISDSIGWRSTQGDDPTLYYCEFCSEAHPDWRNVPHHDECPVFVIRAAIAKATTPMSNKPAQPQPAVRIQTMEEAMEESLRMVRGEPASPVEMLNVECSVCCSLEPCAHDCAEPAAPSEMPDEREQAPANTLPSYDQCSMRIAQGKANELERFIHEYDDADSYRSAWFLHRLELVVNELRSQPAPVRMSAELETVLIAAHAHKLSLRGNAQADHYMGEINAAIAAVRAQAAGGVKLPKVRELILAAHRMATLENCEHPNRQAPHKLIAVATAALAELDAAERGE